MGKYFFQGIILLNQSMKPDKTKYTLATSPSDYRRCRALWATRPDLGEPEPIAFPTVMAMREGELVGFLGSHPRKDMLIAEPMIVKRGPSQGMTVLRLNLAYENFLRSAGMAYYYFNIPDSEGTYQKMIEKALNIQPYAHESGYKWYRRYLIESKIGKRA